MSEIQTTTTGSMAATAVNSPATGSKRSALAWLFTLALGVTLLFAFTLFVLEPWIRSAVSPIVAQFSYIGVRVIGLAYLAYGLTRYALRNRFQTLSTVLLVGFVDQVFIKGFWLKQDIALNPGNWQGFEPTNAAIFVNLATGYLFFIPVVLILSFLGMESTRFRKEWKL